ncbi:MAG: type IV-A pilus assembly ATPase PilB [Actinobacteria bacterium]|nr:MAG: type IV-A pilus assembly ATPase PilB [Actinomycetota bacterium]
MKKSKKKLGQIVLDAGLITEQQLEQALNEQDGKPIAKTMVELGMVSEAQIASALAKEMGIPYVDLANYKLNHHASTAIPQDLAQRYEVIPIDFEDDALVVAMFDPSNVFAIDDLRILTGYEIRPVISTESDILNAISLAYQADQQLEEVVDTVDSEIDIESLDDAAEDVTEVADKNSPVVKIIDSLLVESVRQNANDIHVEPQENEVRIRYRIDGVLHDVTNSPKKIQGGLISRLKIMSGLDIAERRVPQDGRFGLKIDGKAVDFRVATLPTVYGEKVVIRLLEKESINIGLPELGMSKYSLDSFSKSFTKPYGAILVTGPTGCGKTTTLYAALTQLNSIEKNLITVEDPVEYKVDGVNQVQINMRAGLTFAAGLRSILRNDPDIVMIGEIRDKETAKIAIESALTGHLVLSTLHTNDSPSTLTRLIEMDVEPFLIASAVDVIVAQRLARKLCKYCKQEFKPSKESLLKAGFETDKLAGKTFYRAVGCKKCSNTGYKGRVGIFEIMRINEEIQKLTVGRATGQEIKRAAIKAGMKTLKQDGFEKVMDGVTSLEEIVRVTVL